MKRFGRPAGSILCAICRYLWCDSHRPLRPLRGDRERVVSAPPAGAQQPPVLAPRWLAAADREALTDVVQAALQAAAVHPVAAIHLGDVLTELHVAAARDAVWPASAARVRLATGWGADVLPVRLSDAELTSVLALPDLPTALRDVLTGGAA